MEIILSFIDLFTNYTFRNVIIGSALLGMVSGVLSVFTVLKDESLLSEALSHSVLPGIGIAFIVTGYKDPLALSIGATILGFIATGAILTITQNSIIKKDAAMAVVLSTFFGLGIVIVTFLLIVTVVCFSPFNIWLVKLRFLKFTLVSDACCFT